MTTMDFAVAAGMGMATVVSAVSFGMIAKYFFDHGLADHNDPFPNSITLYRKYKQHTKAKTG